MTHPQYRLQKKSELDKTTNLIVHEKTIEQDIIRIVCAPQKELLYIEVVTPTITYLMDDFIPSIPKEPYCDLIVRFIEEEKLEFRQENDPSTPDDKPVKRKASQEDEESITPQAKRFKESEDKDPELSGTYRITPKENMINPLTYEMQDADGNKLKMIIDPIQHLICYHTHTIFGDEEVFDSSKDSIDLIETVALEAMRFMQSYGIKLEELNTSAAEPAPQNDLQKNASQESAADIFAYQEEPDVNPIEQELDSQESIQDLFAPTFKLQTTKQAATGANEAPEANQELVHLPAYLAALVRRPEITDDISSSEDNSTCPPLGDTTQADCE